MPGRWLMSTKPLLESSGRNKNIDWHSRLGAKLKHDDDDDDDDDDTDDDKSGCFEGRRVEAVSSDADAGFIRINGTRASKVVEAASLKMKNNRGDGFIEKSIASPSFVQVTRVRYQAANNCYYFFSFILELV